MKRMSLVLFTAFILSGLMMSCEEGPGNYFDDWDLDADAEISKEEFYERWHSAGYWDLYDRNKDGVIDQEEWNRGLKEYYDKFDQYQMGAYENLDNENDSVLTKERLADVNFVIWDIDGDGRIDSTEFRNRYFQPETKK